MAAQPHGDHVVRCPPSAPHGGDPNVHCARCCCLVISAAVVAGILLIVLVAIPPRKDPVFSVAVAGVAGLDPARDLSAAGGPPALSPVLNVTVNINNVRNAVDTATACVTSLSTATVSYGDAFLGKGSVPEFCAGHRQESEHVVRVWGQDVVVPKFLRDKLAGELAVGEAAVDVKVTMPDWWCSNYRCEDRVLVCKAKIGGGLSPCQVTQRTATPRASSATKS